MEAALFMPVLPYRCDLATAVELEQCWFLPVPKSGVTSSVNSSTHVQSRNPEIILNHFSLLPRLVT